MSRYLWAAVGAHGRDRVIARQSARRRRLLTRTVPLGAVAVLAFAAGIVYATGPGRSERAIVVRYVTDWEHGDFSKMYALLDASSRNTISETRFAAAYATAAGTATAT